MDAPYFSGRLGVQQGAKGLLLEMGSQEWTGTWGGTRICSGGIDLVEWLDEFRYCHPTLGSWEASGWYQALEVGGQGWTMWLDTFCEPS